MSYSTDNLFPPAGFVRVGTAVSVPSILIELGHDPKQVFSKLDLKASIFSDPDQFISYKLRSQLFYECVTKTKCMHFGLLVGQHGDLSSFGLAGLLAQQSPNVGTALRNLVRYFHLHVRGAGIYLEDQGEEVFLGYSIFNHSVAARQQTEDGANALSCKILLQLCGPDWQPSQILFSHYKPSDIGPYQDFFQGQIIFDAERNGVLFSRKWMDKKLPKATSALLRRLKAEVDRKSKHSGPDFAGHVRRVLASALFSHQATATHIAELFSIHPRTLNRRLAKSDTSFKKVTDEVRYEIARQLLEDSSMQLFRIAEVLDYSEASAFTRAFKRWSGVSPSLWRTNSQ